ncbi:MAG: DMT family transporter [Candidatus Omnitrophica bacterium]|nr:DMT family transporter [Candidatus Omnitrophota bacterium]
MKKTILRPTLAAVGAVLLFSTGGLCIKSLPIPSIAIAGLRSLIAAAFLGIYLYRRSQQHWLPRISRTGAVGAAGYVVMTISYVVSMKLTTAANAIFLQYTMPAWVLIGGAIWLKESITIGRIASIALSLIGMFLFFQDELTSRQWDGNMAALLSGFGYAVVALSLRKDRDSNPIGAVFWGNALTALLVLPALYWLAPETGRLLADWRIGAGLLWLGIFQIGVAYLCFVSALHYLPAIEVAIISLIEPILNPFWVYLYHGEVPGRWAVIGGVIILFSVLLRNLLREESADKPDEPTDFEAGMT